MAPSPLLRLVAATLASGLLVAAAPAPPVDDPEATVVSELVVPALRAGPAWWRVSKGASTVWVLGLPSSLPRDVPWDRSLLAFRLAGARRLIVPPAYSAGISDFFSVLRLRGKLKSSTPIEPNLPPDLRARFVTASAALSQKPQHYDGWKPAVAGLLMVGDFRRKLGIDERQPLATVRSEASRRGVRTAAAATYKAIPFLKSVAADLTEEVNLACLSDALQEIEAGQGRVRGAAQAWARGDVPGALTAERGYERCLAIFPEFAVQVRRTMSDEADSIARELDTPGVVVAAIPLRALVAQDGVLTRLQARGYEVRTPALDRGG